MSFRLSVTPSRRAATRFVETVRRALQRALAEEQERIGLKQADLARSIGVNRSVISRELNGYKDLTLSRVAELAQAMGRLPTFSLPHDTSEVGGSMHLTKDDMVNLKP